MNPDIQPFVTTWVDLEGYPAEPNKTGRKGQEPNDFTHMWDVKQKATNEQMKQTHRQE